MKTSRLAHAVGLLGATLMIAGCTDTSPTSRTIPAETPTPAVSPPAWTALSAQGQAYTAAIAAAAPLTFDPAIDTQESFTTPAGRVIDVQVQAPRGANPGESCPSSSCYVMRPIGAGESPDAYFPAAVTAAVAAGAHKLLIPSGVYDFVGPTVGADASTTACNEAHYWLCTPHWIIGAYPDSPITAPANFVGAVSDLDIDLGGSTLNFAAPDIGIWIVGAVRLRLENFTIDWPRLQIASLGTIVQDPQNPGHNALVLDHEFSARDALAGAPVQIQAVDPWDDSSDPALAPGRFDLTADNDHETYFIFGGAQPTYVGATSAGAQTFSCSSCNFVNSPTDPSCSMFDGCANFDGFAAGARVIVRHYTYNGFAILANWSNDVELSNVTIATGPGMGIAVANAGGFRGLAILNFRITRAPGRLISTASDGINVSQFQGDVVIEGTDIGFQGDDAVNVSPLTAALAAAATGTIAISASCEPDLRDAAVAGDSLGFFDASGNYLGAAGAATATGAPCSGASTIGMTLACGPDGCAAALPALTSSDGVVDLTQQPVARYFIKNNVFHDNRGHGTVTGAPFGAVLSNTFSHNSMGPTANAATGAPGETQLVQGNFSE